MENNEDSKLKVIRDYFMTCPLLKDGALNIDNLDYNAVNYSINSDVNSTTTIKKYRDGGKLNQFIFNFMSAELRSPDVIDQINAFNFYEKLEAWIKEQNKIDNLPNIAGVQSLETMSPAFLYSAENSTALYQIQFKLTYLEEVE